MKKKVFGWTIALLEIGFAAVTAVGLAVHQELIWGLGLGLALFTAALLPALMLRQRNLRRCVTGRPLAKWTYSYREADRLAEEVLAYSARKNRAAALTISICLALLGGVFAVVLRKQFPQAPLWQLLLLLVPAVLPWLVLLLHRLYRKSVVLRDPCETVIGANFLIWGNTRPTFNEHSNLRATDAKMTTKDGVSHVEILYRSIGHMRYGGKIEYRDIVHILVPEGQQSAAQALVATIRSHGKEGQP